jgi:signal transduction histidine kinase/ActR/RegA family two-component response regulator
MVTFLFAIAMFATVILLVLNRRLRSEIRERRQVEDTLKSMERERAAVLDSMNERQKVEGELLKTQKLESIGVLAGGIAHDFNNMLTAVMGYITLAKMQVAADSKTAGFLGEAEKASTRAKELAQKLLTFSKGGEPIKRRAQISSVLKKAIDPVLSDTRFRCDLICPDDLFLVEFDPSQIEEAFRNILINAKEAMPQGGCLHVKVENVFFGKESLVDQGRGHFVKISIKDEGAGIPSALLGKVFDPYFSTKPIGTQKGMGLGLSITHSIIKKHHGLITVESELGQGTTVDVYLPAADDHPETLPRIPAASGLTADAPKGRILVMDDEEIIWDVAGQMLNHMGYETAFAINGDEAIQMYQEARQQNQAFDAVILDLTIKGGMGGRETIIKLMEVDPLVKAFVSSGYSDDPVVTGYKAYGFTGVIVKPYNIQELGQALDVIHQS